MKLRSILLGLCLLPVLALAAGSSAARAKPARPLNVVLILADDLGWGDVGFNGRKDWDTPHLDRLARQGTLFTRWYTNAVVCAPSRAALLTGQERSQFGTQRRQLSLMLGAVGRPALTLCGEV